MDELTLFAEEPLVRRSVSLDSVKDWMIHVATSRLLTLPLLQSLAPSGWFGRTSPVCCRTQRGRLEPSSGGWGNSGMGSPTGFLTLNTCEWNHTAERCPSGGDVCSLSDILEPHGSVPRRYFWSRRACVGILRRAERRGKVLPEVLARTLQEVAGEQSPSTRPR